MSYSNDFGEDNSKSRLQASIDGCTEDAHHHVGPFCLIQTQYMEERNLWDLFLLQREKIWWNIFTIIDSSSISNKKKLTDNNALFYCPITTAFNILINKTNILKRALLGVSPELNLCAHPPGLSLSQWNSWISVCRVCVPLKMFRMGSSHSALDHFLCLLCFEKSEGSN